MDGGGLVCSRRQRVALVWHVAERERDDVVCYEEGFGVSERRAGTFVKIKK